MLVCDVTVGCRRERVPAVAPVANAAGCCACAAAIVVAAAAVVGVPPEIMGIGPAPAIRLLLERAGLGLADIARFEINEAQGAQTLAVQRELGLDVNRLNVHGGAIALGHPIGASGTRVLVTLLHEMQKRDAKKGLATLCIGGGMGIALCVERD